MAGRGPRPAFFGCALTIAWPAQPAGLTRECGLAINDDDITSEPGNTGEGTADGGANPGGHDGGADGSS
jgi:hypothetical protein